MHVPPLRDFSIFLHFPRGLGWKEFTTSVISDETNYALTYHSHLRLYSNKTALRMRISRPPGPRAQGSLIRRQPLVIFLSLAFKFNKPK